MRNFFPALLSYLAFIMLSCPAISQDKKFDKLLVSDGLIQSAVVDIYADPYNYLWFATRGGLSRYDGYSFRNYLHNPEDSTTLSNSSVWKIIPDSLNNLWIGTSNGLNYYDRAEESFVSYHNPFLENNNINDIDFLSSDRLILTTQKGLIYFDVSTKKFQDDGEFGRLNGVGANSLCLLDDGGMVIGSDAGLFVYRSNKLSQIAAEKVNVVFKDSKGRIWVGEEKALKLYSAAFGSPVILDKGDDEDYKGAIVETSGGEVVVSKGTLDVYDLSGQLISSYRHSPDIAGTIMSDRATSIAIGEDGIWWIGINGKGLNYFDPNKPDIKYIGGDQVEELELSEDYVTSFYTENDEVVYIGTGKGLDVFYRSQNEVRHIYPGPQVDFVYHEKGNLWFAINDYLLRYRISTGNISRYYIEDLSRIKEIYRDEKGNIWLASQSGLIRFDPVTSQQEVFLPLDNSISRPTQDWITSIMPVNTSEYLIGTASGLYSLDTNNGTAKKLKESFTALQNSYIKCIEASENGTIWIGTWGEGLYSWNVEKDSLQQYTRNDGLPDDVIYGVLEDDDGYIWLSSNNGLSRFNPSEETFFNINASYGLQSNEFNTSAYFKSPNNILYFGGVEGLNYFDPANIENKVIPQTYIEGIQINNEEVPGAMLSENKSIMELGQISLNYKQNMLSFDFKGSNLTLPELNQYAYYLEGLEDDWNYVGNRRYASYTSIAPGDYILHVKSSNNNGYWDETPAKLRIIIKPPFWQTWWFRALVFITVVLIGYFGYQYRVRSLKAQKLKLEEMVDNRTSDLKQIIEILKNNSTQLSATGENLNKKSGILASKAKSQAENAKTIEKDVEHVTNHTQKTSENADVTNEISKNTVDQLETIREAVERNIQVMNNITKRIGVLEEIFRQTNILSLNASIEAARAGAYGGGFAIIAGEVRKLAAKSNSASKEIIASAKEGAKETQEVGKLIMDFIPEVQKSAELIKEISSSSSEQSASIQNINTSLSEFFTTSKENSEISEEIFKISSELEEVAKYLNDKVQKLNL